MHGGDRLLAHIIICLLFDIFLKLSFVPEEFMQCVIISLVKKSGNLSVSCNIHIDCNVVVVVVGVCGSEDNVCQPVPCSSVS